MRLQRNREYNEFLLSQEELERRRREARSLSRSPVRTVPAATPVTKYFAPPTTNNLNSNVKTTAKASGTIDIQHQHPSVSCGRDDCMIVHQSLRSSSISYSECDDASGSYLLVSTAVQVSQFFPLGCQHFALLISKQRIPCIWYLPTVILYSYIL